MLNLLIYVVIVIVVFVVCVTYTKRRILPSLLIAIILGDVVYLAVSPDELIDSTASIGKSTIFYGFNIILILIALFLGFHYPKQHQTIVELKNN